MVMERRYILAAVAVAAAIALLFSIALVTVPSEEDVRAKAAEYADKHLSSKVAWLLTQVLRNDTYEDHVVYNRYRVYFGQTAVVDCIGRFGTIRCRTKEPTAADYIGAAGLGANAVVETGKQAVPFFVH